MRTLLAFWAAVVIAAHLPFLPSSLADLDSINYAFAVRDFDLARQQPHPPGAPLYVAASRGTTAALHGAGDPLNVPHALALVTIIGAALAVCALYWLARALQFSTRRAFAAALMAGTVPLFWFSAARPLTVIPALALAIASQALLARAWSGAPVRFALSGAALAAIAMGFNVKAAVLTVPLLLVVLFLAKMPAIARLSTLAAFIAAVAVWAVPLVLDTGTRTVASLVAADWSASIRGTANLVTDPSRRHILETLYATFVEPFGSIVLASIVLGMAVAGLALMAIRERRALSVIAFGYLPYLLIHLAVHDSVTAAYALPLVPAFALLAVVPLDYVSKRAVLPFAAGVAAAGLAMAIPAQLAFTRGESPGFAVIRDLYRMPRTFDTVLAMHHRIEAELKRHRDWEPIPPMRTLPANADYEWLALVDLWRDGYEGPIWFLADPRRTDLRMIDPQRRRLMRQYGWPEREIPFVSGIRPNRIDWYHIQRPGWFLGRGWALSPEIGGLTIRERAAVGATPAVAWARRRDIASTLLLGGRHHGNASDPPVVVRVRIDGRQIDEWPILPGPFVFMRPVLPEEVAGDGTYAHLEIETTWAGSGAAPISLEQFDFQSIEGAIVAYDEGWSASAYSARTGATWRWGSPHTTLWLYNPGRDLTLVLSGQAARRPFGRDSTLIVQVGNRKLATFSLDGHFTHAVTIPVEPLSVARGRVTLLVDDGGDRPYRMFDVSVH